MNIKFKQILKTVNKFVLTVKDYLHWKMVYDFFSLKIKNFGMANLVSSIVILYGSGEFKFYKKMAEFNEIN